MKNTLWTFGCSFTDEYSPVNCTPPNFYDLFAEYRGGSLPLIWAKILSNKLNLDYQNKGNGAISNYSIFYNFCDWCTQFKEGDVILVQWTTIYRFLMANEDNELQNILPSNDYSESFNMKTIEDVLVNRTKDVWFSELVKFTKIINELCKEKRCNLFYWSYSDTDYIPYLKNNFDLFDEKKWITYKDTDAENRYKLLHYLNLESNNKHTISTETNGKVNDFHLGELGHKLQAEYFYNHIKKQL